MGTAPVTEPKPGVLWQIFAYLGGMTAYAVHLLVSPALVPLACEIERTWPLHLLTAGTLVVVATAGFVAWRLWTGVREERDEVAGIVASRRHFVGLSGLMLNALAFAIVVFAEIPNHVLNPCLP